MTGIATGSTRAAAYLCTFVLTALVLACGHAPSRHASGPRPFPTFSMEKDPVTITKPTGEKFVFARTAKSTCGQYALAFVDVPVGAGPPMHLHYASEEWFYSADAPVTMFMQTDDRTFRPGQRPGTNVPGVTLEKFVLPAGQLAYSRSGIVHDFDNEGTAPVRRFINMWVPGDGMLEFVQEFSAATMTELPQEQVNALLTQISAKWGVPHDPSGKFAARVVAASGSMHGDDQYERLEKLIRSTEHCNPDRPAH
jgi:oxalate decarboxylase/phosphoglucose isomerase-like protein (cupin superfamily)